MITLNEYAPSALVCIEEICDPSTAIFTVSPGKRAPVSFLVSTPVTENGLPSMTPLGTLIVSVVPTVVRAINLNCAPAFVSTYEDINLKP